MHQSLTLVKHIPINQYLPDFIQIPCQIKGNKQAPCLSKQGGSRPIAELGGVKYSSTKTRHLISKMSHFHFYFYEICIFNNGTLTMTLNSGASGGTGCTGEEMEA